MFEKVTTAPADPILGLSAAFQADSSEQKVNLSVGVYQDDQGKTPLLKCVQAAEQRLVSEAAEKTYLPISGDPKYAEHVQRLLWGVDRHPELSQRGVTCHCPGGTGALRIAGEFLRENFPNAKVWLSRPTWPNHPKIFAAARVATAEYPYFDANRSELDFAAMTTAIKQIPAGDVMLLHGCCHNPTGADLTAEQWSELAQLLQEGNILPLIDFAYQGFATGIEPDATAVHAMIDAGLETIVCSSFSKNFGLYRERVGAITFLTASSAAADAVRSQANQVIRANYSNPPAHGAAIVTTVLSDEQLTDTWHRELAGMRDRINNTRAAFVAGLSKHGAPGDWSFLSRQRGMFSFSGLTPDQVDRLRDEYAIYIVRSGRINVAGLTPANMDYVCQAIAAVM